jgi:N-acetylglucosaminyldiphosphoundecaprenol N-acetyl-beta-D-mannosaminyltransferase
MQTHPQLWLVIGSFVGAMLFWLMAAVAQTTATSGRNQQKAIGATPFLGAMSGVILSGSLWSEPAAMSLFAGAAAMAFLGHLRDTRRISWQSLLPYIILTGFLAFQGAFPENAPAMIIIWAILRVLLITASLAAASLVYEMPYILLATSTLTQFILFTRLQNNEVASVFNLALLIASIMLLVSAAGKKRYLIGNSGIFCSGFILAAISNIESSGQLLVFALFVPSMVIVFPFLLICAMIIISYFGNNLHKPADQRERRFTWNLQRERTLVFAGLIFLCLNFAGLLCRIESQPSGYFSLFLLLVASLYGFIGTFTRKADTNALAPRQIELLGIKIDAVLPDEVLDILQQNIRQPQKGIFHVITADSLALVRAQEEEDFKQVMQRAELVVPDGAGVVWAADFSGKPLPGRVPGVALVSLICERAAREGWKIFFLGGKPQIADQAAEILCQKYSFNIGGIQHGYFAAGSSEEDEIIKKIRDTAPDIIFVALGVPRQEWFISKLRCAMEKGIAIGIGGSFDVISQTLPRAPEWMQRCGIEWLFRLWLEPSRFGRMIKIPVFVLHVLRNKWNNDQ